jgi:hypothetical protein
MLVVCLEAAAEHAMDRNLASKGRVCEAGYLFACTKVMVFISKMCRDPPDLNV